MQSAKNETKESALQNYCYRCINKSIVQPYLAKFYFPLFFKCIPIWLTANFVTIISFLFMVFVFTFMVSGNLISDSIEIKVIVFAVCSHLYMVGDHLDGMQAKRTKTSSPLGEFIDHHLDIYNGAIIVFALFALLSNPKTFVFLLLLWLHFIAFIATFTEQKETGVIYFESIGPWEGSLVLVIFLLLWAVAPIRKFWNSQLIGVYEAYYLVLLIFACGYIANIVKIIKRLGYFPKEFRWFSFFSLILSLFLIFLHLSMLLGWTILLIYCAHYAASLVSSHVLKTKNPLPDFVVPFLTGLLLILKEFLLIHKSLYEFQIYIILVYIIFRLSWVVTRTFYALRIHWHWTIRG